jgi:uncharacterized protein
LNTLSEVKTISKKPAKARGSLYLLVRWLHLYTSMISLLVALFFAATGITLNHPELIFGTASSEQNLTGTLPKTWLQNGKVDWLVTAETLRAEYGLKGLVSDNRSDENEASISFRAPAYAADAFIQIKDGTYSLKVVAQGPVAVLNDLHRGRDSGKAWAWLIDLSGGFLLLVAFTGFGLSLFMKKTRQAAILTALAGTVLVLVLMRMAT